ncbi:hypothetical protein V202x_32050 [Gimesia aquarii]|uniref:Uncharacterized protein n=1 Tax=Gimesia aquarii TaxID=2527964 RepID=A0A517WX47_9PLAN|nr:hypothetical protein V202x_32050 [Gimesia aquarii]
MKNIHLASVNKPVCLTINQLEESNKKSPAAHEKNALQGFHRPIGDLAFTGRSLN